jgi:hypothetical protein
MLGDAIREWERSLELDNSNEAVHKKLDDARQHTSQDASRHAQ